MRQHLSVGLNEIRLFVRILPMLGLLGTVDGMMTCFEQLNSDDVLNAVSEGISQAMLTTLAGLLAALSGMYLAYNLKRQQEKLLVHFANQWKSYEN
ncbi:MotA/TolQ/ExbB proton channel family protein [Vibrio harveyi]|uniref:MotA/TolQ/ExbB proton channel family protein n=1 Tax=Vibrio harveyi TaxID=669 RepID=UPI0038CDA9EE